MTGCSTNTHTLNHCGGIDIPVCKYQVEGQIPEEEQLKLQKRQLLKTMNMTMDLILQKVLEGMTP